MKFSISSKSYHLGPPDVLNFAFNFPSLSHILSVFVVIAVILLTSDMLIILPKFNVANSLLEVASYSYPLIKYSITDLLVTLKCLGNSLLFFDKSAKYPSSS